MNLLQSQNTMTFPFIIPNIMPIVLLLTHHSGICSKFFCIQIYSVWRCSGVSIYMLFFSCIKLLQRLNHISSKISVNRKHDIRPFTFQTVRNEFSNTLWYVKLLKSTCLTLLHKSAANTIKYGIKRILYNFLSGNGHDTSLQVTSLLECLAYIFQQIPIISSLFYPLIIFPKLSGCLKL